MAYNFEIGIMDMVLHIINFLVKSKLVISFFSVLGACYYSLLYNCLGVGVYVLTKKYN